MYNRSSFLRRLLPVLAVFSMFLALILLTSDSEEHFGTRGEFRAWIDTSQMRERIQEGQRQVTNRNGNNAEPIYPAIMTGCPSDWPLQVSKRSHEDGVELLQICRGKFHRETWSCADGWERHQSAPRCVQVQGRCNNNTSSSTEPYDCALIRQPRDGAVSYQRRLVFIHIPKTGGSSIESSFLFRDNTPVGGHHKIRAFEEDFFKSYFKFAMVRHPCSRLISLWSYYAQGLGNKGDKEWVKDKISNRSLGAFDIFVEETLGRGGPVDPLAHHHLQTQVGMMFDDRGQFALDQLLLYERWNESIDILQQNINEDLSVFKGGRTHRLKSSHGDCGELYTKRAWDRMREIYAIDFCVLGYPKDVEEFKNLPPMILDVEELSRRFAKCTRNSR